MCIEEKNITENVYNVEKEATIILDLKKFLDLLTKQIL